MGCQRVRIDVPELHDQVALLPIRQWVHPRHWRNEVSSNVLPLLPLSAPSHAVSPTDHTVLSKTISRRSTFFIKVVECVRDQWYLEWTTLKTIPFDTSLFSLNSIPRRIFDDPNAPLCRIMYNFGHNMLIGQVLLCDAEKDWTQGDTQAALWTKCKALRCRSVAPLTSTRFSFYSERT